MKCIFFETPDDLRRWLKKNHQTSTEQWIGFYKKDSKLPSITWRESVDQALCFGWIDGLRKSIDEVSYKIRFTPRKPNSHWSVVNISRITELIKLELVQPAGLQVYNQRNPKRTALTAYEQSKKLKLSAGFEKRFKQQSNAWEDFNKRPPSYRKQCIWWIMSAKKTETQERRLNILIDSCEQGQKIPPLRWQK